MPRKPRSLPPIVSLIITIFVVSLGCSLHNANADELERTCLNTADDNENCVDGMGALADEPVNPPSRPGSEVDSSGRRIEKSIFSDPEIAELARKNGVITDPDEIARLRALAEEQSQTFEVGGEDGRAKTENSAKVEMKDKDDELERLMNVRYEDGGLLVTAISECADFDKNCKDIIDANPSACDDPQKINAASIRCRASCRLCTSTLETSTSNVERTTIGVLQENVGNEEERAAVKEILEEMIRYLREEVLMEKEYVSVVDMCNNKHNLCAFWAGMGECSNNPGYMIESCSLACKTCNELPGYLRKT